MEFSLGKVLLIVFVLWICITIYAVILASSKLKRFNNYQNVVKGMEEEEMLKLMGGDYSKEVLPKFTRYVWTLNSNMATVHKVVIDVKDGLVKSVNASK